MRFALACEPGPVHLYADWVRCLLNPNGVALSAALGCGSVLYNTLMTIEEKLIRDIETLRESIRLAGQDLRTGASVAAVLEHGKWCREELEALLSKLATLQKTEQSQ